MNRTVSLVALLALCACRDEVGVVARVGRTSITMHELDVVRARTATPEAALASAIDTAALVELARSRGLLDEPLIMARAHAAERDAIATAMLERVSEQAQHEETLRSLYEKERDNLSRLELHVRHIVVRPGEGSDSKVSLVAARLHAGQEFASVARELSDDAPTREQGGELPRLREGTLDPTFFAAASKLKRGERSGIVATPFGSHFIEALADPVRVTPTFEQAKPRLAAVAAAEARAALLREAKAAFPAQLKMAAPGTPASSSPTL